MTGVTMAERAVIALSPNTPILHNQATVLDQPGAADDHENTPFSCPLRQRSELRNVVLITLVMVVLLL